MFIINKAFKIIMIVGFLFTVAYFTGLTQNKKVKDNAIVNELNNAVTEVKQSVFALLSGKTQDLIGNRLGNFTNSEVKVLSVVDGDTLYVMENKKKVKIRMLLIDTPESVKQGVKPQPYSIAASKYLKQRLKKGDTVAIEKGKNATDKYGRTLAYVFVGDENINLTMVKKGYARVAYVSKPNTKYLEEFKKEQTMAKKRELKIWSIKGYVTNKGFNVATSK
ncbi:thermonuclease family protein [Rummeliibacillus pycnus]|uniref:thermonuclease family protein n=1 Tax=Rummeliibacillus pycnus TaxID=101070 RepID=UPI003D2C03BC